jgi:hypothetical protein
LAPTAHVKHIVGHVGTRDLVGDHGHSAGAVSECLIACRILYGHTSKHWPLHMRRLMKQSRGMG